MATLNPTAVVPSSGSSAGGTHEHKEDHNHLGVNRLVSGSEGQGHEKPPARASIRASGIHPDGHQAQQPRHRRSQIRHILQGTQWYHSKLAVSIRHKLHGKVVAVIMVIALLLALFLPDSCVIGDVSTNVESDIVLFTVMIFFMIEFFLLCSVDATYLLSFFFFMDIIGTFSMIFDVSWMLGPDITKEQIAGDGSNKNNLMLLRASRTARVGARAGRLSRVLKVLRFLPFLTDKRAEMSAGMSKAISGQLANLLATRVACLTILLVMVIPLFDLLSFPQSDYSLQTWVERLSAHQLAGRAVALEREIKQMVSFYDTQNYGPFVACIGYPQGDDSFHCNEPYTNWNPTRSTPERAANSLLVHTDTFMVGFNFETPAKIESWMAILNILFIMFIMVFSGMALSSVVTALAVAPLENMLATVRQIATTVFNFRAGDDDDVHEEEEYDIDSSSEMKLLEKVVQKLAVVADLQMGAKGKVEIRDDMEEEDIGILNMMEGKNLVEEKHKQNRRSMAAPRKQAQHTALQDFGVPPELVNSYAFNTIELNKSQRLTLAVHDVSSFHDRGEGFVDTAESQLNLKRFVQAAEAQYLPNPFHNFSHALDVLHYTARIMRMISSEDFLNELEQFSLLIAAVGHDLGHPGVNNGFLSEVGHELALQYNDRAPLENMHCAKLYAIATVKETDIFKEMTREQYREARGFIIESILHTDMMVHNSMVKELQMMFEMNSEVFSKRGDEKEALMVRLAEADIFNEGETKMTTMQCILHSADVSNPCRTWEASQAWAWCVLEEFFAQGDQEKMLGIPVQFLNDRDKLNRPNSQIGFLEFMIAPFVAAQVKLWPGLHEFGDNLSVNIGNWEQMWTKEVGPDEETRAKVVARVEKVQANLHEAKSCGYDQGDKAGAGRSSLVPGR